MHRLLVVPLVLSLASSAAAATLTAQKSVSFDAIHMSPVTYVVHVANSGGSPVAAEVIDNVPATLTNVSAAILSGGGSVAIDHTVNNLWWTGVTVPALGSADIQITGQIRSGAPGGTPISNTATVQYDSDGNGTLDAAIATNSVTITVPSRVIQATIANEITSPSPVVAGSGAGNLRYRITVTASASNERAAYFTIAETPDSSPSVTLVSATPSSGTWDPATRQWSTDWILPGQSATLDVVLTVAAGAPSALSNSASIVSGVYDFVTISPVTTSVEVRNAASAAIPTLHPLALLMLAVAIAAISMRWIR